MTEKKEKTEKKAPKKSTKRDNAKLEALKKELEAVKETVKTKEEEATKEKDNALRHMAELENFRRRKQQEVDSFKKFAAEKVITEFLPVVDHFNMAAEHANNKDQDPAEVIKGFMLIQKQLENTLEKLNVSTINAVNQAFDHNLHQAIGQEKSEEAKSGTVIKEVQKGFQLSEKVIRPAMVIVAE